MKHFRPFCSPFLTFLLFVSLASCRNEEEVLQDRIEKLLPGEWQIFEMVMSPDSSINHFGNILEQDTVLTDVGLLKIPDFSILNLDLDSDSHIPVEVDLILNGVLLNVQIEHLFVSGEKYLAYLRTPSPPLQNSAEWTFISESEFFTKNYIIHVIDNNTLVFQETSGEGLNQMALVRQ
ncbi:MAG: hypothetical protein AAF587_32130 [Bacteroidota bacterium]